MKNATRSLVFALAALALSAGAAAQHVVGSVTAGSNPTAVALNPVTNKTYVANLAGGTVTVIDNATHAAHHVTVGSNPIGIAVNPVTAGTTSILPARSCRGTLLRGRSSRGP